MTGGAWTLPVGRATAVAEKAQNSHIRTALAIECDNHHCVLSGKGDRAPPFRFSAFCFVFFS